MEIEGPGPETASGGKFLSGGLGGSAAHNKGPGIIHTMEIEGSWPEAIFEPGIKHTNMDIEGLGPQTILQF